MDIRTFLAARFAEEHADATAAQQADPAPWRAVTDDTRSAGERPGHGFGLVIAADDTALWDCEGSSTLCMTAATARHVARWDPARVLAEIAAKRKTLDLHRPVTAAYGPWSGMQICSEGLGAEDHVYAESWPCGTVKALAAPYANHHEFNHDPDWS